MPYLDEEFVLCQKHSVDKGYDMKNAMNYSIFIIIEFLI